jgi:hypothetical protein
MPDPAPNAVGSLPRNADNASYVNLASCGAGGAGATLAL